MGGNNGGRYIQCDAVNCKEEFSLNLPWNRDTQTLGAAREAGWQTDTHPKHYCPKHRLVPILKKSG